ncbi:MAG TPA: hypothetical protein VN969_44245 [Streptosporangiaceae bacterium]|nr:hypothetical protein [Streptosporangiaceae bacterium]
MPVRFLAQAASASRTVAVSSRSATGREADAVRLLGAALRS